MLFRSYLAPLRRVGVDTVILGCTHYPLLKSTIARAMGPKVQLIDSARQVALKTQRVLEELRLAAPASNGRAPQKRFFVTDEPKHFERLAHRFLGRRPGNVSKADVTK